MLRLLPLAGFLSFLSFDALRFGIVEGAMSGECLGTPDNTILQSSYDFECIGKEFKAVQDFLSDCSLNVTTISEEDKEKVREIWKAILEEHCKENDGCYTSVCFMDLNLSCQLKQRVLEEFKDRYPQEKLLADFKKAAKECEPKVLLETSDGWQYQVCLQQSIKEESNVKVKDAFMSLLSELMDEDPMKRCKGIISLIDKFHESFPNKQQFNELRHINAGCGMKKDRKEKCGLP